MKFVESLKRRWVVWAWNHTPNCAEMSRLASLAFEKPLPLPMRFKMWMHHLICVWCRRYTRHLRFLHRTAPQMQARVGAMSQAKLSEESKRRMMERLNDERHR